MRQAVRMTLALCLFLAGAAIAEVDRDFPDYRSQELPTCAVIWSVDNDVPSELDCLPNRWKITESTAGKVTIGFRHGAKTSTAQRVLEHELSTPEPIQNFILAVQECYQASTCNMSHELLEVFEVIARIDLGEGTWKFQLATSSRKPVVGPVYYFFKTDEAIIAIESPGSGDLPRGGKEIFPYFIIRPPNLF